MMAAAHGQPVAISERGEIVRMRCLHHETNEPATLSGRSENAQAGQFRETLHRVVGKFDIMFENFRAANPFDVIDRSGETDRARDVWSARFKSVRRLFERALLQRDA